MLRSCLRWSRRLGMELPPLGLRHSTTRCLEAGRLTEPVRACGSGRGPNGPDVKPRSILFDPLGPGDDCLLWANGDPLR